MLGYRGIATNYQFLSTDKFAQYLGQFGYIKIDGTRSFPDDRRKTIPAYIIMIAPGSNYALSATSFRKLCPGTIPVNVLEKPVEIMFISEEELTSNIKKEIAKVREKYPYVFIESYNYWPFYIELPKHAIVPPHSIASEKEVKEFCEIHHTKKENFPKIKASDPVAVWYGPRPGEVMKIQRLSESAGHATPYRLVIKG